MPFPVVAMDRPQNMGGKMIKKKILNPNRIRRINGGFSFIPHRFLTDGFLASLEQKELLLFLFLVIVSDRNGLSFYSYDTICSLLQLNVDQYIKARDALIDKDLMAFDGTIFQVLELPLKPVNCPLKAAECNGQPTKDPTTISDTIRQSFQGILNG
jgi:hypothetical protein